MLIGTGPVTGANRSPMFTTPIDGETDVDLQDANENGTSQRLAVADSVYADRRIKITVFDCAFYSVG